MRAHWLGIVGLALISHFLAQSAPARADAPELVHQLGEFPAAIDPRIQGRTGQRPPVEQRRAALYVRLRVLGAAAVPALRRGLTDADVQVRRNVALYLAKEGANYAKHAPEPLDLKPFLSQLVIALRDDDQRVKELSAQALEYVGPDAVIAVPDLLRLLADPSEGLRNSACIGLAGIGPAASEALPALRRALSDPSNDVRRFAQRAIDRIAIKHSNTPECRATDADAPGSWPQDGFMKVHKADLLSDPRVPSWSHCTRGKAVASKRDPPSRA